MSIPDPPRSVRWSTALAWQWPLGLIAGILLLIASAMIGVFWLRADLDLPFDDFALDSGARLSEAQVTQVDPEPYTTLTEALYVVRYTFDLGDGRRMGASFTGAHRFSPGTRYPLEYLAGDPTVNRLQGTTRAISTIWMPDAVGYFWLPCLIALAWWFRGVFRLRHMLGNGPVATAEILATRKLWFVNPSQLSVRYRYADRYGEQRTGRHWVRLGSAKGQLLSAGAARMDVVYDEMRRSLSRLVNPRDFAGSLGAAPR